MFFWIIFTPFVIFMFLFFFGSRLNLLGVAFISISSSILVCLFTWVSLFFFIYYNIVYTAVFCSWFYCGVAFVNWAFQFDGVSLIMLVVVGTISALVQIYSIEYMKTDPNFSLFMSYLSLFTFFMFMLVTSDNLVQMFFGWEGVGLTSYLLINFWHTRIQANKSGIKAMIVNRVGDFGLSIGIFLTFFFFKTLDFSVIFSIVPFFVEEKIFFCTFQFNVINLIAFFFFIGVIGKSSQLGLHTWLPDAMEGPTPVSALIHAATMVTAGVFLLIRFSPLFEYATKVLLIVAILGALTSFFAATVGLVQNDLKKVVAYSTCSQLGYMVFICGISNYASGLFHLFNHAFFKALLFLSAGSIIHALYNEQDMRRMGGLLNYVPFTYSVMVIGSFSLMGFPFLSGFYSKDFILEFTSCSFNFSGLFLYWVGTISAFFTSFYSFRLLYFTFWIKSNVFKKLINNIHEPVNFMLIPLFSLSIFSIFIGYCFKDLFIGLGSSFFALSIFTTSKNSLQFESEFIPFYIKLIPVLFSIMGASVSFFFYNFFYNFFFKVNVISKIYFEFYKFYNFFYKKWYFDIIYNFFFVNSTFKFGYFISFKILDKGFFEYFGPSGFVYIFRHFFSKITNIQSGFIYHYIFLVIFGIVLIIFSFFTFYFFYLSFKIYVIIFFIMFSRTRIWNNFKVIRQK